MKVKRISLLISLTLLGVVVNGQVRQPHSLYFMNTIPQVTQMNPAFQPRANGYVILPANINADFISDIAFKDAFQKHGNEWFSPIHEKYDYSKLYKSIGKETTMFNSGTDWDIFGFGFRTKNGYLSFGLSEHFFSNTALPSDLFKVSDKGFPDQTSLDFSATRTQMLAYMQFNIGYSYKVNDNLTIGLNVKPLFGQMALETKINKFTLYTGEDQWDLDGRGNVYSSLPIDEIKLDSEGKIDDIVWRDFDDYYGKDFVNDYFTAFRNPGIAFDLGAIYQINERFDVSASLNNLGFISWKNDLNSISFNGKYKFNGVYFDASGDDDIGDLFSNLGDSIADAMNYVVKHNKFKTALPPVFHAGVTYHLSKSISAGFLSRSVFWQKGIRQSFNLSLNLQPYSFVAFNVNTTYQVKGNVYLGGGLMFFLGPLPLQFYILTDYAPVYYSTFRTKDGDDLGEKIPVLERQKSVTLRLGLNLVFGRHGYQNKPMFDKKNCIWN